MTPAPGKKRGRKPSTKPTKVRTTITLDPDLKARIESVSNNLSLFFEDAVRKELKRLSKRHPGAIGKKEGGAK